MFFCFFFFNDTATTEIYTLSLHDALPISSCHPRCRASAAPSPTQTLPNSRSEEHTSELQSHVNLVCRLLLEKKQQNYYVWATKGHQLHDQNKIKTWLFT